MARRMVTIDGNEAAAYVVYHTNDVIAIYPMTPASPMANGLMSGPPMAGPICGCRADGRGDA